MHFDAIVTNPGRLRILTALAVQEQQEFVQLRQRTLLTDGNLSSHAKRLQSAGLVAIDKTFRDGKPVTQFRLTPDGRKALETHVRRLMSALSTRRIGDVQMDIEPTSPDESPATPQHEPEPEYETVSASHDDWVD